jgi:hypothetical protein
MPQRVITIQQKQSTNTKQILTSFLTYPITPTLLPLTPFIFTLIPKLTLFFTHSFLYYKQQTTLSSLHSHSLSLCNSNGVNTLSLHSSSFLFPFCPHCSFFHKPRFTTSSIFQNIFRPIQYAHNLENRN